MIPTPIKSIPEMSGETVEERFRRLDADWHRDTDYLSSMEEADRHPAYQEIGRLGHEVVPLLLRDLADNHTHWFAALEAITGTLQKKYGATPGPQEPMSSSRAGSSAASIRLMA